MAQWLELAILALATWRVTSIIHSEKIAYPLRRLFGAKMDKLLGVEVYPDTFLGHLIQCFWCVSVWVAAGSTLVYLYDVRFLIPFAISALAIFMNEKAIS